MTDHNNPSVLAQGAGDGVYFGVYLASMFALTVYSDMTPPAGIIGMIFFLAAPGVLLMLMWRHTCRQTQPVYFSSIACHGMITSICASLIVGVVAYVMLRFVRPDYITDNIKASQEVFNAMGKEEAQQFRAVVRQAGEAGALTASSLAVSYAMLYSFLGVIGALINAFIIKLINPKSKDEQNRHLGGGASL